MIEVHCQQCRTVFSKKSYEPKRFCSRSCSTTYNNQQRGFLSLKQKECGFCHKTTKNPKYCSVECSQKASNKQETAVTKFLAGNLTSLPSTRNTVFYNFLLSRQNGKCAICPISPVWNDKKLTFIRDHIDGNSENNKPNNIRLICPNCDSQLDTYKSKNRGKGRVLRRLRYQEGKSF